MKVVYRLSLLLLVLLSPSLWAKPVLVDQAIAIVNNEVITQTDYDQLKATVERNARLDNRPLPPEKALRRQLMDKLIDDQLILQQAKRMGIEISDAQLDQTIENIIQQSGKSRQQFIKDLKTQQNLSYREFQRQIRQQLLINQTSQSAVRRQINIDKQAVKSMVERLNQQGKKQIRYHIEHIMVKFSDSASPQAAQKQAQRIMAQLKSGANFTKLALSQSQGPKALKGGDWGWMGINEMPTIFAQVIHQQPAGTLIGPFKSDAGYHILKIAGVKGIDKVEATEVKVRHILIKPSIIMSDAKAREQLSQIRKDILSGKGSFAQYARQYSQDTGSAVKGGELGWTDPSSFVPAFRKMVETLPIDQISQPFHSQFGWHIVEVEARRKTDKTAESKQQQAFQILYRRQYQEQMQNWLDDLRRHSYIKKLSVNIH